MHLWCTASIAQHSFDVIPLGVLGGADESNLSSYMVAPAGSSNYICLDAGTLNAGLQKAIGGGALTGTPADLLKNNIKGYMISHPHLDHLAGLIINSPDDSPKSIYGTSECLDVVIDKYFSWKSWANFGSEGEPPQLKKYTYARLKPGVEVPLQETSMHATAYVLSHASPQVSTAFLVRSQNEYLLYLGDTGADEIEKSDRLAALWRAVSPLVKSGKLKAIFIEVSFPDEQPANLLFGHLTPTLLMKELARLRADSGGTVGDVTIVITHLKPGGGKEQKIREQLSKLNASNFHLVFPEQGKKLEF